MNTAEEMGRINREIRQLEDQVDCCTDKCVLTIQIDIEKKKEMTKKLEEIKKDYDMIKEENTGLEEQIKKLKAQQGK